MIELSPFNSIFEIFALVYIGATTIRAISEDVLKPILEYYKLEEKILLEKYTKFNEAIHAQGRIDSIFFHIYYFLISKTPDLITKNGNNTENFTKDETDRLIKKYRPLFFYSSFFCFIALIISGSNNLYLHKFYYRFLFSSYLLCFWHIFLTYKKKLPDLDGIWICNNWIFNTIFIFVFSLVNHSIFSLLSLTNLQNFYNYFNERILGQNLIWFSILSVVLFAILALLFYLLYFALIVPIKNIFKYIIFIIPTIEIIIRLPNILGHFHFDKLKSKIEIVNDFIAPLSIIFVFLPIIFLFLEQFLPSVWNKIKLKFLTNVLSTIHKKNIALIENTGILVNDVTIDNIGKSTPLRQIIIISFLFLISLNSLNIYLKYSRENIKNINFEHINTIKTIILKANETEFNLYLGIPNIDSSKLNKYFAINKPAYKKVLSYANKMKKQGYFLCSVSSTQDVNVKDIKFLSKDSLAVVNTSETWKLEWYNPNLKLGVIKYDTSNTHEYWLEKIKNEWKIKSDNYQGKSNKKLEKTLCLQ